MDNFFMDVVGTCCAAKVENKGVKVKALSPRERLRTCQTSDLPANSSDFIVRSSTAHTGKTLEQDNVKKTPNSEFPRQLDGEGSGELSFNCTSSPLLPHEPTPPPGKSWKSSEEPSAATRDGKNMPRVVWKDSGSASIQYKSNANARPSSSLCLPDGLRNALEQGCIISVSSTLSGLSEIDNFQVTLRHDEAARYALAQATYPVPLNSLSHRPLLLSQVCPHPPKPSDLPNPHLHPSCPSCRPTLTAPAALPARTLPSTRATRTAGPSRGPSCRRYAPGRGPIARAPHDSGSHPAPSAPLAAGPRLAAPLWPLVLLGRLRWCRCCAGRGASPPTLRVLPHPAA